MKYDATEWCSHCNAEEDYPVDTENLETFVNQKCKGCGERILLCGQCTEDNCGTCSKEGSGFVLDIDEGRGK